MNHVYNEKPPQERPLEMFENSGPVVDFIGKVISTAVIVLTVVWRALNRMITTKVKEQLDAAMKEITRTTSSEIHKLREEIKAHEETAATQAEARTSRVTERIDELFTHLMKSRRGD